MKKNIYNIPNINAYKPDETLNKNPSFLLHFIDRDNAHKLITNITNIIIKTKDFLK